MNAITRAADTSNSSSSTDTSSLTNSSTKLNQQTFLKLLVTQLTNQDPMNPMDQTQMLAQLAQFSTVEGINNLSTSQTQQQGINIIGKYVQATVTTKGTQSAVEGYVTGMKIASDGIHLTILNSTADVMLADVKSVYASESYASGSSTTTGS